MSDAGWALIRETIVANYEEIKRKLARSLGSRELASEVIQETYLRFLRADGFSAIEKPEAFIYRTALNIATDKLRRNRGPYCKAPGYKRLKRESCLEGAPGED
jgi:DNA-directed RNA polymerase specialized sigma24 family protein